MTEGLENVVPITAGSGTNVRTVQATLLQKDGTRKVVEMQVVVLSDDEGNIIGCADDSPVLVRSQHIEALLEKLIEEIKELKTLLR